MSERISAHIHAAATVIDIRSYSGMEGNILQEALSRDVASAFIEASNEPEHLRIWPYTFYLVGGTVTQSLAHIVDVQYSYSQAPQYEVETQALLEFRQKFIDSPLGSLICWISPPGSENQYSEARINIGLTQVIDGYKAVQCYGIPASISSEECFSFAQRLITCSDDSIVFSSPSEIHSRSFSVTPLSEYGSPWSFMKDMSPFCMSLSWDAIENGIPQTRRDDMQNKARNVTSNIESLSEVKSELEYLAIGSAVEWGMLSQGLSVQGDPCDLPWNHIALESRLRSLRYSPLGSRRTLVVNSEPVMRCVKCPYCKETVDAYEVNGELYCSNKGCEKHLPENL